MQENRTLTVSGLAASAADLIGEAFVRYHAEFKAITERARERFEECDWHGLHRDAEERLDLHGTYVREVVQALHSLLENGAGERDLLAGIKQAYTALICERDDFDIAQSFYNSVLIRVAHIAGITGVDSSFEFMGTEFPGPPASFAPRQAQEPIFITFRNRGSTQSLISELLWACGFRRDWHDMIAASAAVAARIEAKLAETGWGRRVGALEMARPIFYRGKRAYLVGKVQAVKMGTPARFVPLVIALSNDEQGVRVDAVLMSEDEVSILFSFAREYFHVEVKRPFALVQFLRTIMPLKPVAELYISLGYNKHGKTQRYRDLMRHLANSTDRFVRAQGDRGMVMQVFTLPSYDLVFKIIKDSFDDPKRTTRREVRDRYALVFRHDRGGRLVDAQEFEHLRFARERFDTDLLDELLRTAARTVRIEGDNVVIEHLYTERRLMPLNLYLRQVRDEPARAAVVEYGNAIKDLASTNIFPGDILLKNFGVTRHDRIVFYDYDELCLLTDCNFREMPQAGGDANDSAGGEFDEFDEFNAYAPEPWFTVAENDVFPEELHSFLGLPPELKTVFVQHHGELFTTRYWSDLQTRLVAGEVIEVLPYRESSRLA